MRIRALKRQIRHSLTMYLCLSPLLLSVTLLSSCVATKGTSGRSLSRSNDGPTFPTTPEGKRYFAKAKQFFLSNNKVDALKMFEKSIEAEPTCLLTMRSAALTSMLLMGLNRNENNIYYKKAKYYASYLVKNDHETLDGYFILGTVVGKNDPMAAIRLYKKFQAGPINFRKSIVVKEQSGIDGLYADIGYAYGALKDYRNALLYLEKFIATCNGVPLYAGNIADAKRLVPMLEKYVRYQAIYEAGPVRAATAPQAKPASPDVAPGPVAAKKRVVVAKPAAPSPAPAVRQGGTEAGRKEYLRMREELENAFRNRSRQLDLLTG